MRSRVLLAVVALPLLTAGCTGTGPVTASLAPSPARTVSAAPTPSQTALPIPSAVAGEITRSTVAEGVVDVRTASLHGARGVLLDVRCSGAAGESVDWAVQTASGNGVGPSGTTVCGGDGDHVGQEFAGPLPARVKVDLQPGRGVTAAYAILSRD